MKLTVRTDELQEMVNKASHCVTNNKLLPMTSLINTCVKSNSLGNLGLMLTTTDGTNFFTVWSKSRVDCEEFEISVLADKFIKLIQKTTSETVTLSVEDDTEKIVFVIKGNGTYKMEIPLENGKPIKFPRKVTKSSLDDVCDTVKVDAIREAISVNHSALATDNQQPVLTAYYCGDTVITSNRKTVCRFNKELLKHPILVTSIVMDLLSALTSDTVDVYRMGEAIVYKTDVDMIYAPLYSNVEEYPVEIVDRLISQEFTSVCTLPRNAVLNILDRISLFVGSYDRKSINLTFTQDGLVISNKKSSGTELVPYVDVQEFKPFTCHIHIEFLRDLLASQSTDAVDMYFGAEKVIKLVSGDVTQVVALLQDDEVEEG